MCVFFQTVLCLFLITLVTERDYFKHNTMDYFLLRRNRLFVAIDTPRSTFSWYCLLHAYHNAAIVSMNKQAVLRHSRYNNRKYSSSYPSIFWSVGRFPSGIVASHSFHCCISVSSCVSGDLFKYCSRCLPTAFFRILLLQGCWQQTHYA
jgi:hypothetical protein